MKNNKITLIIAMVLAFNLIPFQSKAKTPTLSKHQQDLYVKNIVKNAQAYARSTLKKSPSKYFSQYEQDKYVNETFFNNKSGGIFVDIGAHNGVTLSNTYFFEKYLGWSGICFEPMPDVFQELQKNRACLCINGCVSNFTGTAKFLKITSPHLYTEMLSGLLDKFDPLHLVRIEKELQKFGGEAKIFDVQCYLLNDILTKNALSHIDYLSIDTEGGELDILKAIDFDHIDIGIIDVENNYNDKAMKTFLETKGYLFVKRILCDEIYQKIVPRAKLEL